jgi:hypothetical protein
MPAAELDKCTQLTCSCMLFATGDYGFDPLKLSEDPAKFDRLYEAELLHARWVGGCRCSFGTYWWRCQVAKACSMCIMLTVRLTCTLECGARTVRLTNLSHHLCVFFNFLAHGLNVLAS